MINALIIIILAVSLFFAMLYLLKELFEPVDKTNYSWEIKTNDGLLSLFILVIVAYTWLIIYNAHKYGVIDGLNGKYKNKIIVKQIIDIEKEVK